MTRKADTGQSVSNERSESESGGKEGRRMQTKGSSSKLNEE